MFPTTLSTPLHLDVSDSQLITTSLASIQGPSTPLSTPYDMKFQDEDSDVMSKGSMEVNIVRPVAAFTLWCKDHRDEIAKKKTGKKYITKTLSARWKKLSPEEKLPYQEKEKQMKEAYEKAYGNSNKAKLVWPHNVPPMNAYEVFVEVKMQNLKKSHKHLDIDVVRKQLEQIWNALYEEKKRPFQDMYLEIIEKENKPMLEFKKPVKRTLHNEPVFPKFASVFDSPQSDASTRFYASEVNESPLVKRHNGSSMDPSYAKCKKPAVNLKALYQKSNELPIDSPSKVEPSSHESTEDLDWMDTSVNLDDINPTLAVAGDFPWNDVCDSLGLELADLSL